jgi:hypothetical protein
MIGFEKRILMYYSKLMDLLFENDFSGWGQFLQSFCRSTHAYVITRGFATRDMTYMHLYLCKSFARIVPHPEKTFIKGIKNLVKSQSGHTEKPFAG